MNLHRFLIGKKNVIGAICICFCIGTGVYIKSVYFNTGNPSKNHTSTHKVGSKLRVVSQSPDISPTRAEYFVSPTLSPTQKIIPTVTITPTPGQQAYTLPLIDSAFFDRKDLIYGSEIGSWVLQDSRYDGHYMLNYKGSCPTCPILSKDAPVPVVRWAVADTFPDQINPSGSAGTMVKSQFDNVINGIRTTLQAHPFIKLQPIKLSSSNNFCPESWGSDNLLAMDKNIIKQAGNKIQLYEIANEMENVCNYSASNTGTKVGQFWIQIAPKLKKYARSLGFEIYIGGPAIMTSNINATTDTTDLKKTYDFLQTIKTEYDSPTSSYYHDQDIIPSFVSFHAYGIEYVNIVGGSSTPLDAISHYGDFIDNIKLQINSIWGSADTNIKVVCSEWNVGAETYAFPSPTSENYYTQFLQMLKDHHVGMGNQFLMASNNNKMDMITETGLTTPYYTAFKNQFLTDSLAKSSRNGVSTKAPTPGAGYASTIKSDTPLAYWRLGETSGTTAKNDMGSSYAGSYTSSPSLGQNGVLLGDGNSAVTFDGSSAYVSIPYNSALNPSGAFSVELWAYPTSLNSQYQGVVASRAYPNGWVIYKDNNNNWSFWINSGAGMLAVTSPDAISNSTWYHLVATFDGTTAKLYVNGIQVASGTPSTFTANSSQTLTIGQGEPGSTFFFAGRVDEVSFYNTALSKAQVTSHFQAGIY